MAYLGNQPKDPISVSTTAPSNPKNGAVWFNSALGETFVYYDDGDTAQWVQTNPSGQQGPIGPTGPAGANGEVLRTELDAYLQVANSTSFATSSQLDNYLQVANSSSGTTVYSAISDLPLSGNESGAQAYVSGTNRLYLWTGTGWYNIALINTQPSLSGASASYTLNTDGSNTVVTLTSTDPEGLPISFTASHSGLGVGANAIATVTQSNNIFTFTPTTNTSLGGTFTSTFTASDGVNLAVANSSFTLTFVVPLVSNSNYTHALFTPQVSTDSLDNKTILDSSSSNRTITNSGSVVQYGYSPFRAGGYSLYFDGATDSISYPQSSSFDFGTGDFTLECWFWPEGTQATNAPLFSSRTTTIAPNSGGFELRDNGSGAMFVQARPYGNSSDFLINNSSPTSYTANAWNHFAVVRNGNILSLYLNGSSTGSATLASNDQLGGSNITFCTGYVSPLGSLKGYVADFRVVKGTAVYTSTFTPPTERLTAISGTSLLTGHLPHIADGSTNGHTITVNNNVRTEAWTPFNKLPYSASVNGGSFYLNGGSYVQSPAFGDNSTTWTVECWIRPRRYYSGSGHFDRVWSSGTSLGDSILVNLDQTTGAPTLRVNDSVTITSSSGIQLNAWYHVALVCNGSSTTMYLNGTSVGSVASAYTFSSRIFRVGTLDATQGYFYGHVTDMRVVLGSAVYTSNFTPPTAPLTAITNTSLLLNGTNAGVFDKSSVVGTHDIYAGIESSTTQTKFNSTSIRFDGTGYIRMHFGLNARRIYTADFTLEAWVYRDVQNAAHMIFASGANPGTNIPGFNFLIDSDNELKFINNSITTSSSGLNFPASTWKHVAVARDYNQVRMFVDGTLVATYVSNWSMTDGTMRIGTNSGSNSKFSGYMDDIRITYGLARYTANFTPPTAALDG